MFKFSQLSENRLLTCDTKLQYVVRKAILLLDFSVLWGYRDEESQNKAYAEGHSKVKFPYSRHNTHPSRAVDLDPYPIDWENIKRFIYLGGIVRGIADAEGVQLRWGGDWNSNGVLKDESFRDYGHFELIGE